MSNLEIWVLPFPGQGHLFPSMELCKLIASRNFKTTLLIPSDLSAGIPSSFRKIPLIEIAELPRSPPPPLPPSPLHQPQPMGGSNPFPHHPDHHDKPTQDAIEKLLLINKPVCAVVDIMMSWTTESFNKFEVPIIGFFTSGACSAAMEYALWEANLEIDSIKPGEVRLLPDLPEEMGITEFDLKTQPHGLPPGGPPPSGPGSGFPGHPPSGPPPSRAGFGFSGPPPHPGGKPRWLEETDGCSALIINSCDEMEHPFIQYISTRIQKPVWGIGPLLPEQFWKPTDSILHDHEIRSNRRSTVTEDEVKAWLDTKPPGSTLYVCFGSEVGPTNEEYPRLAEALQESNVPFIWAIQSSRPGGPPPHSPQEPYFPHGLDKKVGERGLIINGWAPQLLILSHPSTAGFLSHCGWNSTMEGIGCGVPFLAWPIRGDQHHNAKLIVKHLKIGYMVSDDLSKLIQKEYILKGIEKLFGEEASKRRAKLLSEKFKCGFPATSLNALDGFEEFVVTQQTKQER